PAATGQRQGSIEQPQTRDRLLSGSQPSALSVSLLSSEASSGGELTTQPRPCQEGEKARGEFVLRAGRQSSTRVAALSGRRGRAPQLFSREIGRASCRERVEV